jgi:pectinesterase
MLLLSFQLLNAQYRTLIVVDQNGSGNYRTLAAAIASLPMFNYQRLVILIKNGVYTEKIRIDQDYITLQGESRDSTIIRFNQLREAWNQSKDSIGPAVINLHVDDIVIDNLTIENTQPEVGPHAFAIYGTGTRTIISNCKVLSKGGDTVALWNYKTGMYYHTNCYFEGAVDFVCPRGWCYISDSQFYEVKKTAALWHAGGYRHEQKFVLVNCYFDGVQDFRLGRHHYEAQFYLLDCQFSENMDDRPIYWVTYADSTRNRPFNWGERYYFNNCHRVGSDFQWFEDNLNTAEGAPRPEDITPSWTFSNQWNPESTAGPKITHVEFVDDGVLFHFSEIITVIGTPVLVSRKGKVLTYCSGAGSDTARFKAEPKISREDLIGLTFDNDAKIWGTVASVRERLAILDVPLYNEHLDAAKEIQSEF